MMSLLPWRLTSLRARMTWGFTLPFALFVAATCVAIVLWSGYDSRRRTEAMVREAVQLTVDKWRKTGDFTNAFGEVYEEPELAGVSLRATDSRGETVAVSRQSAPPLVRGPFSGWIVAVERAGPYTVIAGVHPANAQPLIELLVLSGTLAVGAAALLAWVLVGRTLRPLVMLADQAGGASSDFLPLRLSAPSSDEEIHHLVDTLNSLLTRLQENVRMREQFYMAAAHELRTPLAVLSGSIEVALSRPRSPAEYVETLTDLEGEARRLITLAESLLTLNRLQAQNGTDDEETIDVSQTINASRATLATVIRQRGLCWEPEVLTDPALVSAPAPHVNMLIRNLLENAARYASPGGLVRVAVAETGGTVRVRIFNAYLDPLSLPYEKLTEPFFRADASRGSTTAGNGLGLAICHRLSQLNRWRLSITPTDGGVLAEVEIPALHPIR